LPKDDAGEAASVVDAKWLTGREEAAVVPFPFYFSLPVVISKTARHIGHLKGALPIYVQMGSMILF